MLFLGLGGSLVGRLYLRRRISARACYRLTVAGIVLTITLTVLQMIFGRS